MRNQLSQARQDAITTARVRVAEETGAVARTADRPDGFDHRFAVEELAKYRALLARLEGKGITNG